MKRPHLITHEEVERRLGDTWRDDAPPVGRLRWLWRRFTDAFRAIPRRRARMRRDEGCAECRRKDILIRVLIKDRHRP
jgi:hypothetical protein